MRVAARVLAWERAPAGSRVEITLLGPAAMRRANARATGRRGLTDVIAYALPQPDGRLIGDVYICPAAAARAARNGTTLGQELVRLAVHGTLHGRGVWWVCWGRSLRVLGRDCSRSARRRPSARRCTRSAMRRRSPRSGGCRRGGARPARAPPLSWSARA